MSTTEYDNLMKEYGIENEYGSNMTHTTEVIQAPDTKKQDALRKRVSSILTMKLRKFHNYLSSAESHGTGEPITVEDYVKSQNSHIRTY